MTPKPVSINTGVMLLAATMVILLCAFVMTGCAAFNSLVTNNELTMQLATEAATARVIHDRPEWKAQTIKITEDAIGLIDSSALIELSAVEVYIKSKVKWHSMLPEEQALVSVLISQVRINLEDTFRAQAIIDPGAQMVQVRKVLGWMRDAAMRQ